MRTYILALGCVGLQQAKTALLFFSFSSVNTFWLQYRLLSLNSIIQSSVRQHTDYDRVETDTEYSVFSLSGLKGHEINTSDETDLLF